MTDLIRSDLGPFTSLQMAQFHFLMVLLFTGQKLKFMSIKMMNFMKVKQDTVIRDMHGS